jgi:hypothetical protein
VSLVVRIYKTQHCPINGLNVEIIAGDTNCQIFSVEFLTDISQVKYENSTHGTPHDDGGKF